VTFDRSGQLPIGDSLPWLLHRQHHPAWQIDTPGQQKSSSWAPSSSSRPAPGPGASRHRFSCRDSAGQGQRLATLDQFLWIALNVLCLVLSRSLTTAPHPIRDAEPTHILVSTRTSFNSCQLVLGNSRPESNPAPPVTEERQSLSALQASAHFALSAMACRAQLPQCVCWASGRS